jgi:hypothetical protein
MNFTCRQLEFIADRDLQKPFQAWMLTWLDFTGCLDAPYHIPAGGTTKTTAGYPVGAYAHRETLRYV